MVKGRTPELGLPSLTGRLLLGGIPCTWRRATSPRPPNLKFVAAGLLARRIDRRGLAPIVSYLEGNYTIFLMYA